MSSLAQPSPSDLQLSTAGLAVTVKPSQHNPFADRGTHHCQMPQVQYPPFVKCTLPCKWYPSLLNVGGTLPFTAKCTLHCQRSEVQYPSLPNAPFAAKGTLHCQMPEAQYPSLPKVSSSTKCQRHSTLHCRRYPSVPNARRHSTLHCQRYLFCCSTSLSPSPLQP